MDLSVIVSTCNRAEDVERLLASLDKVAAVARRSWELILVDNNSTDATAALVQRHATRAAYPVRYVFEKRRGKSFGLNSGIAVATGRIFAFTDDDAVIPEGWIDNVVGHFETHPDAALVGGRVTLFNPADAPITIQVSTQPERITLAEFSPGGVKVIGCNMAVPARILRELGDFDTDVGPGSPIGVAEDLDMQYRCLLRGYSLSYEPSIHVFHNHGRRTPAQLDRVIVGYLTGRGAFYCKYLLRNDRAVARWAYWECRALLGWNWLKAPFSASSRAALRELHLLLLGAMRYLRLRGRDGLHA